MRSFPKNFDVSKKRCNILKAGKYSGGRLIMSKLYISRVTTKGQVTVPLELRKSLNLKVGDYVLFSLRILPVPGPGVK